VNLPACRRCGSAWTRGQVVPWLPGSMRAMKSDLAERGPLRQVPLPSAADALLTLIQPVDAARGADVHAKARLGREAGDLCAVVERCAADIYHAVPPEIAGTGAGDTGPSETEAVLVTTRTEEASSSPAPGDGDAGQDGLRRAEPLAAEGRWAIRGIGEKFGANPVTGTGSMTVPVPVNPGRSGFGPQLTLSYDSGAANGIFGYCWSLSLPCVTRKTDKGLPLYRDEEESDVFVLSGAEDLVAVYRQDPDGTWAAGRPGFRRDADPALGA